MIKKGKKKERMTENSHTRKIKSCNNSSHTSNANVPYGKGKVHTKGEYKFSPEVYSFFDLGARWGLVVNATLRPFYSRK
jgi:hypothetical protein